MAEHSDPFSTRGLSEEEVADLKEAFDNFDRDKDGSIDVTELSTVLRSLGYSPTEDDLKKLMNKVDFDKSGGISFDEFVMVIRLGNMETDFEKEIKGAFKFFDKNNDGLVDPAELANIMRGLGESLSDGEIALLISTADQDKDGNISMKEFISFMFA